MKNKKIALAACAVLALGLGVAGWYHWQQAAVKSGATTAASGSPAPVAAGAPDAGAGSPAAQPVAAQVFTQVVKRQQLAETLTAFGDVMPQRTLGVSSPFPAQIVRLAVVQGQSVRQGQALATLASDPATRLAYTQAQTAARLASAELTRLQEMERLQLATRSQVETAQKTLDDASAAVLMQNRLGGANGTTLTAPADALVLALNAAQGERLPAGAPLMQLGQAATLKVLLGVDPSQRTRLKKGAGVTLVALDSDAQAPHQTNSAAQGRIDDVQNSVDAKSRLLNVVVRIDANPVQLLPGMRVRAKIAAGSQNLFVVPRQAVLNDEHGAYLFQVRDGKAHRVAVDTRIDNSAVLGVDGRIDSALPLVVLGNYELQDGMPVRGVSR